MAVKDVTFHNVLRNLRTSSRAFDAIELEILASSHEVVFSAQKAWCSIIWASLRKNICNSVMSSLHDRCQCQSCLLDERFYEGDEYCE